MFARCARELKHIACSRPTIDIDELIRVISSKAVLSHAEITDLTTRRAVWVSRDVWRSNANTIKMAAIDERANIDNNTSYSRKASNRRYYYIINKCLSLLYYKYIRATFTFFSEFRQSMNNTVGRLMLSHSRRVSRKSAIYYCREQAGCLKHAGEKNVINSRNFQ